VTCAPRARTATVDALIRTCHIDFVGVPGRCSRPALLVSVADPFTAANADVLAPGYRPALNTTDEGGSGRPWTRKEPLLKSRLL